jgi:predicted site-specific integrase-resolvase
MTSRKLDLARRAEAQPVHVYSFVDWCRMRSISVSTGRRLAAAGKIRLIHLSTRRLGVREDDDRAYLAACEQLSI